MGKKIATIVGLLFAATLQIVAAPSGSLSYKKPPTSRSVSRHVQHIDSISRRNLLADGYTIETGAEASMRISEAEMEKALEEERLNYPAIDLYGEDSWTDRVNPFTKTRRAEIPARYDIDCSGFVKPLDGSLHITSRYGYRPRFGRMHRGVDIALKTGDPVRVAFDGKVRIRGYERGGYGHYIVVRHPNGLETIYGHLSRCIAKEGQIVHAGEVIGRGGSTGRSTGPHLHFETRFLGIDINPEKIIDFSVGAPHKDYYTFIGPKNGKVYTMADQEGSDGKYTGYSDTDKKQKRTSNASTRKPRLYKVQKGDSLQKVAKKTGTTIKHLCRQNNMSAKATLRVGSQLKY